MPDPEYDTEADRYIKACGFLKRGCNASGLNAPGCPCHVACSWSSVTEATAKLAKKLHLGSCLFAAQAHSFVQELGHLLVVGMVLATRTRLDEPVVLQLLHCLLWEALHQQVWEI